jgi:prephenate dehydrogenase
MRINLVGGSGIMGKIHAKVFTEQGHQVSITGRNSQVKPEEAAKTCDITIISVPLEVTQQVIQSVAPFCKAIADFSSVKEKPIEWMKQYAPKDCEILGLHPLYGETSTISGKTIIACKTNTSSKNCLELIEILKNAGAEIIEMTPQKHDLVVNGLAQNARTTLVETFGRILIENKIDIEEFYKISPPPTKIILDLLARQSNVSNDELYASMKNLNNQQDKINESLKNALKETITSSQPQETRKLFDNELKNAQDRAKKYIN